MPDTPHPLTPHLYRLKTRLFSMGRQPVRHFLRGLPAIPPGARVLDVACGTGGHAGIFGSHVKHVGIEMLSPLAHHARRRGIAAAVMDATALGFADNSFERVIAVGLLHHLPDTQAIRAVKEMQRVAKPGAYVVTVDAMQPSRGNVIGRTLCALDRGEHIRALPAAEAMLAPLEFTLVSPDLPGSWPYERAAFLWVKPG